MKIILVPADFSVAASHALNFALDLASHENAKVILLYVASKKKVISKDAESVQPAEKLAKLHSQAVETKNIPCEWILREGEPAGEILKTIKEKDADLLVIGMDGFRLPGAKSIGKNARNLIEKAGCPVMLIPEGVYFSEFQKIIYATDFHESDLESLKMLVNMVRAIEPEIVLLHITGEKSISKEEETKLINFLDRAVKKTGYLKFSTMLLPGKNIPHELEEFTSGQTSVLLAMSTHTRSLTDKIIGRSITRSLAFRSSIPMLVFHYKQKPLIFIFGLAIMK